MPKKQTNATCLIERKLSLPLKDKQGNAMAYTNTGLTITTSHDATPEMIAEAVEKNRVAFEAAYNQIGIQPFEDVARREAVIEERELKFNERITLMKQAMEKTQSSAPGAYKLLMDTINKLTND